MKIRLTDNRGIFLNGKRRAAGYEADVTEAEADALVANGFAEKMRVRRTKAEMKADAEGDDE